MLSDGGYRRHQVRFARPVVPYDKQPLVVGRLVELQVRNDQLAQLLSHPVRDDERIDEVHGTLSRVRLGQLDDGFYGLKLKQVVILHWQVTPLWQCDNDGIGVSAGAMLRMLRRGICQCPITVSPCPRRHDRRVAARVLQRPQRVES